MADSAQLEALRIAIDTRKFEIELFWKRSTFFWAFNAAAFAGFVVLAQDGALGLSILVGCFGFASAVGRALVNLGSKLWYENWEIKARDLEDVLQAGPIFSKVESKPKDHWAVGARRFSVSKITILLSYYVVALWLAALVFQVVAVFAGDGLREDILRVGEVTLPIATLVAVILFVKWGRGADEDAPKEKPGGKAHSR